MSDLVFRTEELTNNQIAELYVASDYEQSIIDKLKAPSPVLLIGSRGVGKAKQSDYHIKFSMQF